MSEGQASLLLRRLGLYARRDIATSQDGRVLSGSLDPYAELLYRQLDLVHDEILERRPLSSTEKSFLAHCQDYLAPHRELIRQLERQFA